MQFVGTNGLIYTTPDKPFASGGEGSVYAVSATCRPGGTPSTPRPGDPQLVVKALKPGRADAMRRAKLLAMTARRPPALTQQQLAWPLDVVTSGGAFAGYVMPRADASRPLSDYYVAGPQGVGGPACTRPGDDPYVRQLTLAYNLAVAVSAAHDLGAAIGDLNPKNALVNDKTWGVTLIDCDSFHVADAGHVYRCGVGVAEYLAPEVHAALDGAPKGTTLETITPSPYSQQTDLFALAVLVFALLMNGCHPFSCAASAPGAACPQPRANIVAGFTPFFRKRKGLTTPVYAPGVATLPHELQELFRRALVRGHADPAQRPSAREWACALRDALAAPEACPTCGVKHAAGGACPTCSVRSRMKRAGMSAGGAKGPGAARPKTPLSPAKAARSALYQVGSRSKTVGSVAAKGKAVARGVTTRSGTASGLRLAAIGFTLTVASSELSRQFALSSSGPLSPAFTETYAPGLVSLGLAALLLCASVPRGDARDGVRYLAGALRALILVTVAVLAWGASECVAAGAVIDSWEALFPFAQQSFEIVCSFVPALAAACAVPYGLIAAVRASAAAHAQP